MPTPTSQDWGSTQTYLQAAAERLRSIPSYAGKHVPAREGSILVPSDLGKSFRSTFGFGEALVALSVASKFFGSDLILVDAGCNEHLPHGGYHIRRTGNVVDGSL